MCPGERGPHRAPLLLLFLLHEVTLEGAISESNTESANTLIFRTVRNTFLFKAKQNFISHPVSGFYAGAARMDYGSPKPNYICKFPCTIVSQLVLDWIIRDGTSCGDIRCLPTTMTFQMKDGPQRTLWAKFMDR